MRSDLYLQIQMPMSSGYILMKTPTTSVLPVIWESLIVVVLTHKINYNHYIQVEWFISVRSTDISHDTLLLFWISSISILALLSMPISVEIDYVILHVLYLLY